MKEIVDYIKLKLSIQAYHNVFPFIKDPNLSFCYFTFNKSDLDINAFCFDSFKWPEDIKNSINKRKIEFLLGRCCAYDALFKFSNEVGFLARTKNGQPVWPDGFVGSISHSTREILAVAAHKENYLSVGIDVEKIICKQDAIILIDMILNLDEKNLIKGMSEQDMLMVVTLIFSVKESFYKLINNVSEINLDFNVISLLEFDRNSYVIRINKTINSKFTHGLTIKGFYVTTSTSIITLLLESNYS